MKHWPRKRLKYLASFQSGDTITGLSIEQEGKYPVYGGNGLRGYTDTYTHEGNFVLIGRQGALCGNINYASGRFWASEHAVVVTPKPGVRLRWLGELLRAMNLGQYSVSAAQPGLSVEFVVNLPVDVPPLTEQDAIAAFLAGKTAEIDAIIGAKEQMMNLLQEKRQALVSRAITRGLDPDVPVKDSGIQWLGPVPTHWTITAIKRFAREGYRTFIDGDWIEAPYITDQGVRLIQTGNIGIGCYREQGFRYISHATFDELKCTPVEPGDVLICRLDGPVGRACLAPMLATPMITSVDVAIVKPRPEYDARYLVYLLSFRSYLDWVGSLCRVGGGHRLRVSRSMLGDFRIPLPPPVEQHRLANWLDKETEGITTIVTSTSEQITKLREYRQTLISAAVTGKMDVTRQESRS